RTAGRPNRARLAAAVSANRPARPGGPSRSAALLRPPWSAPLRGGRPLYPATRRRGAGRDCQPSPSGDAGGGAGRCPGHPVAVGRAQSRHASTGQTAVPIGRVTPPLHLEDSEPGTTNRIIEAHGSGN